MNFESFNYSIQWLFKLIFFPLFSMLWNTVLRVICSFEQYVHTAKLLRFFRTPTSINDLPLIIFDREPCRKAFRVFFRRPVRCVQFPLGNCSMLKKQLVFFLTKRSTTTGEKRKFDICRKPIAKTIVRKPPRWVCCKNVVVGHGI